MNNNFFELSPTVEDMLIKEHPLSVLEISSHSAKYGKLILDCQQRSLLQEYKIDRVDLTNGQQLILDGVYNNIFQADILNNMDMLDGYDVIIIMHLFEHLSGTDAKSLLISLLKKVKKQILVITPEYPFKSNAENIISEIRTFHPVFFLGLDFSYKLLPMADGIWQAYSFFPTARYEVLQCDKLVETCNEAEKLKIAYVLPTQLLTGGMKALLEQMKQLSKYGHTVTAYYRSDTNKKAIPLWSHLTDDDVANQVVIPGNALYLDWIHDADIIVLGWMNQVHDFKNSKTPVVLWEQGSDFIYGDYNKLLNSSSIERLHMHQIYRIPVYLLAVSTTIQKVLKGVYNRDSQLFPNGIDTDFYYPLSHKENQIPVVLLVGNPALEFKGFKFALDVLNKVYQTGIPFKVCWVSPIDFIHTQSPFTIEKFINPPQEKLAELYRTADVLLSTSLYESFPLPPIEAMASGTAVIATDNGGINTYAEPGENCLLCSQGDLESMSLTLTRLLRHPEERELLMKKGRETALKYSFDNVIPQLEKCFFKIIHLNERI